MMQAKKKKIQRRTKHFFFVHPKYLICLSSGKKGRKQIAICFGNINLYQLIILSSFHFHICLSQQQQTFFRFFFRLLFFLSFFKLLIDLLKLILFIFKRKFCLHNSKSNICVPIFLMLVHAFSFHRFDYYISIYIFHPFWLYLIL